MPRLLLKLTIIPTQAVYSSFWLCLVCGKMFLGSCGWSGEDALDRAWSLCSFNCATLYLNAVCNCVYLPPNAFILLKDKTLCVTRNHTVRDLASFHTVQSLSLYVSCLCSFLGHRIWYCFLFPVEFPQLGQFVCV